ncbi:MAG: hypothetical protein KAI17_00475 [Thiotrichaceae bacterium]|nr:hypothetical protein [Thiotrichaceae bacterium]
MLRKHIIENNKIDWSTGVDTSIAVITGLVIALSQMDNKIIQSSINGAYQLELDEFHSFFELLGWADNESVPYDFEETINDIKVGQSQLTLNNDYQIPETDVPMSLTGSWVGNVQILPRRISSGLSSADIFYTPFKLEIDPINKMYVTNYPELGCMGVLTLVQKKKHYRFHEKLIKTSKHCRDGGYVNLHDFLSRAKDIFFVWENPETGEYGIGGTIRRVTTIPDKVLINLAITELELLQHMQTHIDVNAEKTPKNKAIRRLSETIYSSGNNENHDNDWKNTNEDSKDPSLITHALYPFQRADDEYNSGDVPGYSWSQTKSNKLIQYSPQGVEDSTEINEDTRRKPLILIHGWQADCGKICDDGANDDFPNRAPENLAKGRDLNNYDAEDYWDTFLRYFAVTTTDLKERYKLYLYQYPTYKHITFNARMLAQMIPEIDYLHNWLKSGKKITFLTHSMGGLVARSLLEEHDGAQIQDEAGSWIPLLNGADAPKGADVVEKLITLDTPHHGSPASIPAWVDTVGFVDVAFKAEMDLFSPGAMDLWWDGYDNAFTIKKVQTDINNNEATDYIIADRQNSFRSKSVSDFDEFYRGKKHSRLPGFGFDVRFGREVLFKTGYFYRYPNPWLTKLNKTHANHRRVWRDKYILYSGYNDNESGINGHWANRLADTGTYGAADDAWVAGVYRLGYVNDAPVPVTSALFDQGENEAQDGIIDVSKIDGWPGNVATLFGDFLEDKNKNILRSQRNGYKVRFLRDYHHKRMLHGAYYTDHIKHRLITKSSLNDVIQINWQTTCSRLGVRGASFTLSRFYTGFRDAKYRHAYVEEATGDKFEFKRFAVDCEDTGKDDQWLSTLEYEPLFLLIKWDLKNSVGSTSGINESIEQEQQSYEETVRSEALVAANSMTSLVSNGLLTEKLYSNFKTIFKAIKLAKEFDDVQYLIDIANAAGLKGESISYLQDRIIADSSIMLLEILVNIVIDQYYPENTNLPPKNITKLWIGLVINAIQHDIKGLFMDPLFLIAEEMVSLEKTTTGLEQAFIESAVSNVQLLQSSSTCYDIVESYMELAQETIRSLQDGWWDWPSEKDAARKIKIIKTLLEYRVSQISPSNFTSMSMEDIDSLVLEMESEKLGISYMDVWMRSKDTRYRKFADSVAVALGIDGWTALASDIIY